jgi:hypothetical protein
VKERVISCDDLEALLKGWEGPPGAREAVFAEVVRCEAPLPAGMCEAYGETMFYHAEALDFPDRFCIVTAYATTGQTWEAERNEEADRRLEAELRGRGVWMGRLTGYSPHTGHEEPGWAVGVAWEEGLALGARYEQDAIYGVEQGRLFVGRCQVQGEKVELGAFAPRAYVAQAGWVKGGWAMLRVSWEEARAGLGGVRGV